MTAKPRPLAEGDRCWVVVADVGVQRGKVYQAKPRRHIIAQLAEGWLVWRRPSEVWRTRKEAVAAGEPVVRTERVSRSFARLHRTPPSPSAHLCGLPDGCTQVSPTEWHFADGGKVIDTRRRGARRFRWEAPMDMTFTHTGSVSTAFKWATGVATPANCYAASVSPVGLELLTAIRQGAATPRDIAKRAGYSEACVYYTLRQLLAAGAVVRTRLATRGTHGAAPFAYAVAA